MTKTIYEVRMFPTNEWQEITKDQFVAVERSVGIRPPRWADQNGPYTSGFSNGTISGRMRTVDDATPRKHPLIAFLDSCILSDQPDTKRRVAMALNIVGFLIMLITASWGTDQPTLFTVGALMIAPYFPLYLFDVFKIMVRLWK